MKDSLENALTLSSDDLRTVAELITMRFPLRGHEANRVARMRALLNVTAELNRALATYSQHALVHCHGTAGTSDLAADTMALDQALKAFCVEIREVVSDYKEQRSRSAVPYTSIQRFGEALSSSAL